MLPLRVLQNKKKGTAKMRYVYKSMIVGILVQLALNIFLHFYRHESLTQFIFQFLFGSTFTIILLYQIHYKEEEKPV